ncbi:MAG: hypothetical protein U1E36_03750 [Rickettsiales bacterium]
MSDMSGNLTEALALTTEAEKMPHGTMQENPITTGSASGMVLKPITEESPQLLAAQDSMKAILESVQVTPAAGGETGTLSVGDVQAKVDKNFGTDNSTITFSTPIAAVNSISVDAVETALLKELAQYDFFKEHYDLSKSKDVYFGSSDKDVLKLVNEILADESIQLPAELKQKIGVWTERHEKEHGGGGYIFHGPESSSEDEKNRVYYRITADGKSPTDDAIAAKDFVSKNIEERKTDILKAVIEAAMELDAKHGVEKGTPLFTPEEKTKLDVNMIGKIGGLDLVVEDTSFGKSGDVNLIFGTKKEVAPDCKDLPKDQLDATPLSKLDGELRDQLIAKAVRTAGAKASDVYSIVAGSDVILTEIKEALGEQTGDIIGRLDALIKDASDAKLSWRDREENQAKKPKILVDRRRDDEPNMVNITVPVPEGMTAQQVLEGIVASKAVAVPEQDALSRLIGQNAAGKHHRNDDTSTLDEMKVAGGKTGAIHHETPVSIEDPKIEPPTIEAPKVDEPKIEPPKVGSGDDLKESPVSVDKPKIGPDKKNKAGSDTAGQLAQASPIVTEASLAASKVAEVPKGRTAGAGA